MKNYIVLFVLLFTSFTLQASKPIAIHWYYSDMPPAHITHGDFKNMGYADLTTQLFINNLPKYKHVKTIANYSRSTANMKSKDNVCHASLLKSTDREKFVNYSLPVYILSSNKLFIHEKNHELIKPYLTD